MLKTGAINLTIIFIITVTHTTIKTASTDIMAQDVISATKIMSVLMTNHTIIMGEEVCGQQSAHSDNFVLVKLQQISLWGHQPTKLNRPKHIALINMKEGYFIPALLTDTRWTDLVNDITVTQNTLDSDEERPMLFENWIGHNCRIDYSC